MPGSAQIIANFTDLDTGNHGTSSGADETSAPGREVAVPESAEIALVMFLGEAASPKAEASETLAVIVELSVDGGASGGGTWGPIATFRTITASEFGDIDESTGSATFRRAIVARTPKADSGRDGLVYLRANLTADHGSNQFALFLAVWDRGSIRDVWLNDAQVA